MLKPVRTDAGLGNPPLEYTNNDPESANFMIKHGLKFEAQTPNEFISAVKKIVKLQHNNEERAVFGKGPYAVADRFKHLAVDDNMWGRLSHPQRASKVSKFLSTGMDRDEDSAGQERNFAMEIDGNATRLTLTAEESGITTVPLAVLQTMFDKANDLLSKPDLVIPQPGASNGAFIVAGHSNRIFSVLPGKGASLKCDRNCKNNTTGICEHILAVACRRGTLKDFLSCFKRSKKGASLTDMALQGGPKTAGRKPSNRKRTNAKKGEIEKFGDLFAASNRETTTCSDQEPSCKGNIPQQQQPQSLPLPKEQQTEQCQQPQQPQQIQMLGQLHQQTQPNNSPQPIAQRQQQQLHQFQLQQSPEPFCQPQQQPSPIQMHRPGQMFIPTSQGVSPTVLG